MFPHTVGIPLLFVDQMGACCEVGEGPGDIGRGGVTPRVTIRHISKKHVGHIALYERRMSQIVRSWSSIPTEFERFDVTLVKDTNNDGEEFPRGNRQIRRQPLFLTH